MEDLAMRVFPVAFALLAGSLGLLVLFNLSDPAAAPRPSHALEAHQTFMQQVRLGEDLFEGDPAAQRRLGVNLSRTGSACLTCHSRPSQMQPQDFPRYSEKIGAVATVRDMINACVEGPNQGERIGSDSPAMKALEAYIYWSSRGTALSPGG
jgi:thiosulfate dehydrogenase